MPLPTEDLQALANQGALPEAFGEGFEFMPIAASRSPTSEGAGTSVMAQPLPAPLPSDMAPPKVPPISSSTKRKSILDESPVDTKRARRTVKPRQPKRSKI